MKGQSFRSCVISHLGEYKKTKLEITKKGEFNYRGRIITYDHILPIENLKKNILLEYRESFWASDYSNIHLHRFFHHLNSSQALCINLFYPLIAEGLINEIVEYIKIPITNPVCEFEHESEVEGKYKGTSKTNFDFCISDDSQRIYFEVKYTEDGFSSAKHDDEHREKFNLIYKPLLMDNPYINENCKSQDFFLKHYQIMRNLVHIKEKSTVVFLFSNQNKRVFKQANDAYENILTDSGRAHFQRIYVEDLILFLCDKTDVPLRYHTEFREKYLDLSHTHER